jgi:peptide-methionine (S)-S-oxide reductase
LLNVHFGGVLVDFALVTHSFWQTMEATMFFRKTMAMPTRAQALPGRNTPMPTTASHAVFQRPLVPPYPEGFQRAVFGLGCFWGAERKFWQLNAGVWITAVGYTGGYTPNPTYEEVCSGHTGHNEVVLVMFDPAQLSYGTLLKTFFESHDPTQGMRQGNDLGTQYRSGIYCADEAQIRQAEAVRTTYGASLAKAGYGPITTEILPAGPFYFAEDYHQQYLAKNPQGYCGLGGTGVTLPGEVTCPIGTGVR